MNTSNCPVADKVFNKMVSDLQDLLIRLDAKDKDSRIDFLVFRQKTVKQYTLKTFHAALDKAQGSLNVKDLYSGGVQS